MNSSVKVNLKNFLIILGFLVLISVIFLCGYKSANFLKFYSFSTKPIISSFSVTQIPIIPGQPIRWVKTLGVNNINKTEHLLALPKDSSQIKISTTSVKQIYSNSSHNIDRKELVKLSLQNNQSTSSQILREKIKRERATGFWASLRRTVFNTNLLFATVGEITLSDDAQGVEDLVLVDLAPVVEGEVEEVVETIETEEEVAEIVEDEIITEEGENTGEVNTEVIGGDTVQIVDVEGEENITEEVVTEVVNENITEAGGVEESTSTDLVVVEYETPAPVIAEAETDTGKIVSVSSGVEQEIITNVLAFTTIPEIFKVGQEDKIKIKWTNNGDQEVTFHAYDTDDNGKLDYVEWTVPHLSEQIFEIIFISKAFELDENKEIINDIYEQVFEQDNTWVTIPDTHTVRVTFERALDSHNDNTIYAKPTDPGQPGTISVYPVYTDDLGNVTRDSIITTFPSIDHEGKYRIILTGLETPTDMFDLVISSGSVDFDYIVDPSLCPGEMTGSGLEGDECQVTSWADLNAVRDGLTLYYKLMNNLSSTTPGYAGLGDDWMPIGDCVGPWCSGSDGFSFTGSFDGQGYSVSNLISDNIESNGRGLFGVVDGSISNVNLIDAYVRGNNLVGGLVGLQTGGSISRSVSSGEIIGSDVVGGLVGRPYGTISNSYSSASVTSTTWDAGGLVGWQISGTIVNSYSNGLVYVEIGNAGGLVGVQEGGIVINSFYNSETSGQSDNDGRGIPKTTAEMKMFSTFDEADWNIAYSDDDLNNGYPYLDWQNGGSGPSIWLIPRPFADGDGTPEDPYQITSWEDLNKVRNYLDSSFILMNNLSSTTPGYAEIAGAGANGGTGWVPIGTEDNPFIGSFDGNDKTISDLIINLPEGNYVGLFGFVAGVDFDSIVITDIGLINTVLTGNNYVGGLVGYKISGTVSNSYSASTTVSGNSFVGGLVGWNSTRVIQDSFSDGIINGHDYVGGLVGNCTGVIINSSSMSNVVGNNFVGGLVGRGGPIYNSHSVSIVTGNDYIGGLVGDNTGDLFSSYSNSDVSGVNWVGGLVGNQNTGNIENTYSFGSVSGNMYVGGLAGLSFNPIINSYSTASVSGSFDFGGFVGIGNSMVITNSYYNSETSGQSDNDGRGIPKTTAEMKTFSTFSNTGWDIGATSTDLNIGYPFLAATGTPVWWIYGDVLAPTGTITLAGGAEKSTIANPSITLTTNDASQYQLCLNSAVAGVDCTSIARAWSTYTNTPEAYNFVSEGDKTLYVQFKDSAGNISATYSDNIIIDTTSPIQSSWSPATSTNLTTKTPTITFNTNERGDCYASQTDYSYDDMIGNSQVDCVEDGAGTAHSCSMTDLGANGTKNIYISCADYPLRNKDTINTNTVLTYNLSVSSGGGGYTPPPVCVYDDPVWGTCVSTSSLQYRTLTATNQTCTGEVNIIQEQECTPEVVIATTTATTTPVTCTGYTYSIWGECINNQKTRTILTSIPTDCVGGIIATTTEICIGEIATTTSTTTTVLSTSTATTTFSSSTLPDIDTEINPPVGDDNTQGDDNKVITERPSSSGGNKTIDKIVAILDVSSVLTDNVTILGTTTQKIIIGAQNVLESKAGNAVAKTITTAGVVGGGIAASSVLTMGSMAVADLAFLPFKLWGLLLSVLGLKKRNRPWGTVYDSVTKQPIDPAYVTLKDLTTGQESTSITDLDGRYGFVVTPGKYIIKVNKVNYAFPSTKLVGKTEDVLYSNLYFGEEINIDIAGSVINKNIPLDPVKFDWNEFVKGKKNIMRFYSMREKTIRIVTDWIFRIGFVVSLLSLFLVNAPYNLIIFGLYIILALFRKYGLKQKTLGKLIDKNGDPLSFAILRVFDAELNIEVVNKVADKIGRYYCLVNKGNYYLKIEGKNDDESYTLIHTSPVFEVKDGIINKDIKL